MTTGRVLVLALTVAVVAGACDGGSSSSSAPAGSTRSACPASALAPSFRAEDGSAGHYHAVLVLVNTGPTRCRLAPSVSLQMIAGSGGPLPTRTAVDESTGRPTAVVLAHRSRASIQVSWVEISSGEACVTPAALQVSTPNDPHALVVAWPTDHDLVCGHGVITIQPARLGVPRV